MSRLGKLAIKLPEGVQANISEYGITVKGIKGEEFVASHPDISFSIDDDNQILVTPIKKSEMWGTLRSLVNNAVIGVSVGFKQELEIKGVGFKAQLLSDNVILFSLGYSHSIKFYANEDLNIEVNKGVAIVITGNNKQILGQTVAEITRLRKFDPYKSKGIYIKGSYLRKKEGKKK